MRKAAAIAGVGELKPMRQADGRTVLHLMSEAGRQAVRDAGMEPGEIDGLLVAPPLSGAPVTFPSIVAEYMGLQPAYCDLVDLGGASAAGQVWRAAAAIAGGMCTTVLCITGDTQDPAQFYQRGATMWGLPGAEFDRPYGPMGANSGYALAASRHMALYGTTSRQLAKVAADQRANACANPEALFYGRPLTVDDVLNSRLVVDPLHLLEIVMPCSGAAALVVTSPERARRAPHPPVLLLGAGEKVTHSGAAYAPDLTSTAIAAAATRAFAMAGVAPHDIDLVSVYDCYTITVAITLEDAGFCAKGMGGPFIAEHDLTWQGDLPLNTHGGQLSFGQPGLAGGMSHITEAVRQLRGEASGRQVKDCELAYVNGNGGVLSEEVSLVLARG
jgi:acetyl-CoA acetyltransferase